MILLTFTFFSPVHFHFCNLSQVGEAPFLWAWVVLTLGRKNLAAINSTRLRGLRKVQVCLVHN